MPADITLIICTKNRAVSLRLALDSVRALIIPAVKTEVVVVDNDSSDGTKAVVDEFIAVASLPSKYCVCRSAGLGNARNAGLRNSEGSWVVFSDDDCQFDRNYLVEFVAATNLNEFDYGAGQILLADSSDDPRVANLILKSKAIIPRQSFLPAGAVQGANMFFKREVFHRVGPFNAMMGSGTPFPCEDIEMAGRASLGGFTGAQLPSLIVHHHHGRKKFSVEAEDTVKSYDFGRGAYYASLLRLNQKHIWVNWHQTMAQGVQNPGQGARYIRELDGARRYLAATAPPG